MKKILAIAAISTLAFSCAESDIATPSTGTDSEKVTINVSTPTSNDSRVAISEDWASITWEQGDALGGWYSGDASAITKFSMSGTTDGATADFTGAAGEGDLRLIYPYNSSAAITNSEYTLDLSYQTCDVNATADRLKACMMSEAGGTTMKHLATYIDLNMKFANLTDGYTYYITHIEFGAQSESAAAGGRSYATTPTTQQVNMSTGATTDGETGAITLGIQCGTSSAVVNNETYSVKFAAVPFKVSKNASLGMNVYFKRVNNSDNSSNTFAINYSHIKNEGDDAETIEFAAGKYNTINWDVTASTASTTTFTKSGENLLPAEYYAFDEVGVTGWSYTTGLVMTNAAYCDSGKSLRLTTTNTAITEDGVYVYPDSVAGISEELKAGVYIVDHWFQTFGTNTAVNGYEIQFKSANTEDAEWETVGKFSFTAGSAATRTSNEAIFVLDEDHVGGYIGIKVSGENVCNTSGTVQMFIDSIALYATE